MTGWSRPKRGPALKAPDLRFLDAPWQRCCAVQAIRGRVVERKLAGRAWRRTAIVVLRHS